MTLKVVMANTALYSRYPKGRIRLSSVIEGMGIPHLTIFMGCISAKDLPLLEKELLTISRRHIALPSAQMRRMRTHYQTEKKFPVYG
ncbi:MAG: hypothetical protein COZ99_01170 [Parcubacteria group bacterium CG_4_8_14_3_um_filter_48_16]|nr:MAG: hypothetical protein COZ99_01170 [Parcubacteria group bacterium CG_4_8_14_3_um_filter_48_16]PIY77673.1 MAG: hypothetical protein COY83_03995 [Parcubacteria group bacterium CG_4_10_14_0_8_um_filter_48_154]PJC40038.1 MAG: hypothetical protein CO043_01015 [Parcubacteria group bacterium CG_4_9_14_0_2_um_filter_48_40]